MSDVLPKVVHDPEALWAARHAIREAFHAVRRLRHADPTIRDMANRLDEMCVELTTELDDMEPPLPFRRVVPGVPASQNEVR